MQRRLVLASGCAAAVGAVLLTGCGKQTAGSAAGASAAAGAAKTMLNIGMVLEPSGLDPTAAAAAAIGEITLYNVYETLTKITQDGSVQPLLATSWTPSADHKVWTFKLLDGVKFQNGEAFNAETVRFAFTRAAAETSTNKDKALFQSFERIETPDAQTVVLHVRTPNPDIPFLLAQATAVIVEPKSADSNATAPVGTGPYQLDQWRKGASLSLKKWDGFRAAANIALSGATFRFIADSAAQAAALLSGDVDVFPRVQIARSIDQFKNNPRFQVLTGVSYAKTILAMNNARKPLNDVRVRRAIASAIDRQAVIAAAADGLGVPIGSYYASGMPGYTDTTGVIGFDIEKSKALLQEAGVSNLQLTITLPPPPYARQGGEVIAAELAKVGITARLENVEWAQWLSKVYGQADYDMTIISHVEAYDLGNLVKPKYYWNYQSADVQGLYNRMLQAGDADERKALIAQIQKKVAEDCPSAYLYQPQWITVANANLQGVWKDIPIFVNDLANLRWA